MHRFVKGLLLILMGVPSFVGCGLAQIAPAGSAPRWESPVIHAPRLQYRTFGSAAAQSEVSYHVYTPELYDMEKSRRFPVLYWLHGTGGGLRGIQLLVNYFDGAIRAGRIPPMLVVFPNGLGSSMWCDSKDGSVPMETVVVKELVPHIDATFRTVTSREGRLIEGFSMGGYGAGRLGFKYHDKFGAISMLGSGPLDPEFKVAPRASPEERERLLQTVYGGDLDYFKAQSPWVLAEQNAAAVRGTTRVRQVVGDLDETFELNREFHLHLTRLDLPHTFTVLPGVAHNPLALLNALGDANWDFYRDVFGGLSSGPSSLHEVEALEWIRTHAVPVRTTEPGSGFDDLSGFGEMVGAARIVSLGEATHGSREQFQLKHRLIEYLVEQHGFTAIGLEASVADVVPINDFVVHGIGDAESVVAGQGFWTWNTQEVLAMILWLREHNRQPGLARPVRFYGFDAQVIASPLRRAFDYLEPLDPSAAGELRAGFAAVLGDSLSAFSRPQSSLSTDERARVMELAKQLGAHLDHNRDRLIRASSSDDLTWARHFARAAEQAAERLLIQAQRWSSLGASEERALFTSVPTGVRELRALLAELDGTYLERVDPLLRGLESPDSLFRHYRDAMDAVGRVHLQTEAAGLEAEIALRVTAAAPPVPPERARAAARYAGDVALLMRVFEENVDKPARWPNVRDRAMADNVAWMLEREGRGGRVVLWAHNWHVSRISDEPGYGRMGSELARRFGAEHVAVGFGFDRGEFQAMAHPPPPARTGVPRLQGFAVGPARPEAHDRLFARTGLARFALDLRKIPESGPVADWFRAARPMRDIGAVFSPEFEDRYYLDKVLPEHYDVLVFTETTTRARPSRLLRERLGLEP